MLHRFHDRFGTAGVVIGVIALIAALGGTALAAGALSSKQKKEVTKIAKKFAGKPGSAGPAGTAGPAGPNGTNGTNGTNGAPGTIGVSVTTTPIGEFEQCGEQEGVMLHSASGENKVCNGASGTTGFTATLPKGKTETGSWGFGVQQPGIVVEPISFPIPLSPAPPFGQNLYIRPGQAGVEHATECPGTLEHPAAIEGFLCVYAEIEINGAEFKQFYDQGYETGPELKFNASQTHGVSESFGDMATGTWAVTAG